MDYVLGFMDWMKLMELLPETFAVGLTCQIVDLLPSLPVAFLIAAFGWQAVIGFR